MGSPSALTNGYNFYGEIVKHLYHVDVETFDRNMGKKYYCDYCDKSFPDSLEGRKKHNLGLYHQQMKDAHYNQFADSRTKLARELTKGPCKILTGNALSIWR